MPWWHWVATAFAFVVAATGLLWDVEPRFDRWYVLLVLLTPVWVIALRRSRIEVRDGGIVVRSLVSRRAVPWSDVAGVVQRWNGATAIDRRAGRAVVLTLWRHPRTAERIRDAWLAAR